MSVKKTVGRVGCRQDSGELCLTRPTFLVHDGLSVQHGKLPVQSTGLETVFGLKTVGRVGYTRDSGWLYPTKSQWPGWPRTTSTTWASADGPFPPRFATCAAASLSVHRHFDAS